MTHFAAVAVRTGQSWTVEQIELTDCESVEDIADVARDFDADVRLVLIEEDDEYAALVRVDGEDDPLAFLSDGHAADQYPLAAAVAEDLVEIGHDDLEDDEDAPPAHDSAPFGAADIVADLGTGAGELLALCAHEGTLPIEVLVSVGERAGFAEELEELRS